MDRLSQLRGEAGGSRDSTLDSSAALSEAYVTANDGSKYYSLGEEDSSFDISPIKDVSLASTAAPDKPISGNDQLISNLSPIPKKNDLLDSYKFGKQIEAANILSGGVDIFDDNDNSYDGNELVIDDNVVEIDEKSNPEMKLVDNAGLLFQKSEENESMDTESAIGSKDTEVVLQIDGKNVQAIDIGNGLYLYRKQGGEELAAVQVLADNQDQPTFKFLKVRENSEGNLEVYEEIEIEVPKEVPAKEGKVLDKNTSHVPIKDINKVISDPASSKSVERKKPPPNETVPDISANVVEDPNKTPAADSKSEINLNGKMIKFNETRKSPVIHSTPNKEGIPLTKTMVDLQLHPNRHLDNLKTIEVHTDLNKPKSTDTQTKNKEGVEDIKHKEATDSHKQIIEEDKQKNVSEITKDMKESETSVDFALPANHAYEDEGKTEKPTETNLENKDLDIVEIEKPIEKLSEVHIKDTEVSKTGVEMDSKETIKIPLTDVSQDPSPRKDQIVQEFKGLKKELNDRNSADMSISTQDDSKLVSNSKTENSSLKLTSENSILEQEIGKQVESTNKTKDNDEKVPVSKEIINAPFSTERNSKENVHVEINKDVKENDIKNTHEQSNIETCKPISDTTEETGVFSIKHNTSMGTLLHQQMNKCDNQPCATVAENPHISISQADSNEKMKDCHADKPTITEIATISPPMETSKISLLPESTKIEVKENIDLMDIQDKPVEIKTVINKPDNNTLENKHTENDVVKDKPVDEHALNNSKVFETTQPKLVIVESIDLSKDEKVKVQSNDSCQNPVNHIPVASSSATADLPIPCKQEDGKNNSVINPMAVNVQAPAQNKPEVKPEAPQNENLDENATNNNNADVPFGQWTEANRQAFLNRIRESKVATNYPNTKSIKQPNDLNRRDVLQKIDSQRQSSNTSSKIQDVPKINVKAEALTFTKKPSVATVRDSKVPVKIEKPSEIKTKSLLFNKNTKAEVPHIPQKTYTNSNVTVTKQEGNQRKEINNQDLIDKTIINIINRAVSANPQKETSSTSLIEKIPQDKQPSNLDAIEMKMNELHGIPFVERPPHELPRVYHNEVKTYGKADNLKLSNKISKIPNLLPFTNTSQQKPIVKEPIIDLDSEEEVIEHEPVTGDIDLHKKNITKIAASVCHSETQRIVDSSKKETIITEKDFDKFARRNSITYDSCLTMNIEANKQHNMPQAVVEKEIPVKISRNELMLADSKAKAANKKLLLSQTHSNKLQITSKLMPVNEDVFNKNYSTKLQMAYTALTTKRKMESPITIIEDKPVKVVFMDANPSFPIGPLNVQGKELSPAKKPISEPDTVTIGTSDSLDSDILDAVEDVKVQDENKTKTKHQRKQVLTPVEAPELELIVPSDLGLQSSPKKKRKIDDVKPDKSAKTIVPKKSYLLGRSVVPENLEPENLVKPKLMEALPENNVVISHKDAASAIDNLVKAAELIETQSETLNVSVGGTESPTPATPMKRGRGRPRKYPLPDGSTPVIAKTPSPQKKPRLLDAKHKSSASNTDDEYNSDGEMVRENWTMGKINENIVCPICNKLFRTENVVFKHVKHCTSPNRSDSGKRSPRRSRFSLESDSKSMESKSDDKEIEPDKTVRKEHTPKKRSSKETSFDSREDVIVIEDTPAKAKPENNVELKLHESRKITKTKAQYKTSTLSCEQCGKTFRQLSYLVSHKLLHKKESAKVPENDAQDTDKSVFSCEVCKKQFRKLHHLVQHRIIHNSNNTSRLSRKSSSEQNSDKIVKEQDLKLNEDSSAAFRCEPCDKSFRKLHHLVEHRETHDGINRQKNTTAAQVTDEKTTPNPPPQCEVCKKTFRKLHHLIEHKEQHIETSSDKSDDKSVKSSLSTKDIIHECSLCYMVFPNEHSLTKHTVICQRKKRQSALKQAKQLEERKSTEQSEAKEEDRIDAESEPILIIEEKIIIPVTLQTRSESSDAAEVKTESELVKKNEIVIDVKEKSLSKEQASKPIELETTLEKKDVEVPEVTVNSNGKDACEVPDKILKVANKSEVKMKVKETPKTKPIKDKCTPSSVKRRKSSNIPLARIKEAAPVESSDDDENVRYMLNPDYKETGQVFMKVRAKKRNSLQFDRPNSNDSVKRRTSLQHPPKISRLKAKEAKPTDTTVKSTSSKAFTAEPVPSTDSDDSDVKYSFPESLPQDTAPEKTPKEKRKVLTPKRKSTGIVRRKSSVTTKSKQTSPEKLIKRRRAEAEHRCDCGQLFSSAALLARHASLAHTPPRVRRRRPASPPPLAPRKSTAEPQPAGSRKSAGPKPTEAHKSSARESTKPAVKAATRTPGRKPGRPPAATAAKARQVSAHRGVPVPEKMRQAMDKLRRRDD